MVTVTVTVKSAHCMLFDEGLCGAAEHEHNSKHFAGNEVQVVHVVTRPKHSSTYSVTCRSESDFVKHCEDSGGFNTNIKQGHTHVVQNLLQIMCAHEEDSSCPPHDRFKGTS